MNDTPLAAILDAFRELQNEIVQLRAEISTLQASKTIERRRLRIEAMRVRDELEAAVIRSPGTFEQRALMRQGVAHLWRAIERLTESSS